VEIFPNYTTLMYMNGVQVASGSGSATAFGSASATNSLIIPDPDVGTFPIPMAKFDEVAIWNNTNIPIASLYPQTQEFGTPIITPVANFTYTPASGSTPLTVAFTDTSVTNITAWN